MRFTADLHIHSKYSRATAKNLDLENLYHAAQVKGLSLVGTGDFTHPAWMAELETKLEETEPGIFSLKPEIAQAIDPEIPPACRREVRFILQAEISNIYKKDGRVRKNHNLIYMPDIETAKRFSKRLSAIGNIKSDGRPILGLDARDLLEIMLETSDLGFFVPAHIWTPWFSLFGSKSGFDAIEECFEDLSGHIFACETGLSSDPPMNWRVKNLDHVRLISNSDAHSPGFLGRNASVFDTDLDFNAIRRALETHDLKAYQGTLDMYPDQGKYHYDGHRKCKVRLNPDDTAALGGLCPECGRPLTLGVLYRVRELADRPEGYRPEGRHPHAYVVPLADILSEIFEVGPKTKKVNDYYTRAVAALGPELDILIEKNIDDIDRAGVPLLAEAVKKMRAGDLHVDPGYDGEYGKVNIFTREEKEAIRGEKGLFFDLPKKRKKRSAVKSPKKAAALKVKRRKKAAVNTAPPSGLLDGLNPEQELAVKSDAGAVLIQAGPGTGKTRTLTARIAWLISEQKVSPGNILALTFTNKAAGELAERIGAIAPRDGDPVLAATFHGFCLKMLKTHAGFARGLMEDDLRMEVLELAAGSAATEEKWTKRRLREMDRLISLCKQQLLAPGDDLSAVAGEAADLLSGVYRAYDRICRERGLADFEDPIFLLVNLLKGDREIRRRLQRQFTHIFVDEYQDLNLGQYELVKLLTRENRILVNRILAIGDPDQSIYGFRGSDNRFFNRFARDFPGCDHIRLKQNYRSTQTILDASFQMITGTDRDSQVNEGRRIYSATDTAQQVVIKESVSEDAEAVAVGRMIEDLVGGLSFLSVDSGRDGSLNPDAGREYAFSDFAVLYRTRQQCHAFVRAFEKAGIPFQTADREDWSGMAGVRDALGALRLLLGRGTGKDEKNLVQILGRKGKRDFLARGLPDGGSRKILDGIAKAMDIPSVIGGRDELAFAWERLTALADTTPAPGDLLDALRLQKDQDLLDRNVEKVSLMTMHGAKGLEFPVVFVTGCETGLVPYARDGKTVQDPEEERRLFYVAMTRAMDILCLTYAKKRRIFGLGTSRKRSGFIDDIEARLARLDTAGTPGLKQKMTQVQLELF